MTGISVEFTKFVWVTLYHHGMVKHRNVVNRDANVYKIMFNVWLIQV